MPALERGFRNHLLSIADVSERDLNKLVEELMTYWSETPQQYVLRRHRELQRQGLTTGRIYPLIASELSERLFAAPPLSERQIRRIIYG